MTWPNNSCEKVVIPSCPECPECPEPTPCPSWILPQGGFLYRQVDILDPLATVGIYDCNGELVLRGYPTSGAGHTIPVYDADGTVIAYAQNLSLCGIPPCQPAGVCLESPPEYCASWPLPDGGYLYRTVDSIDPAASVPLNDCNNQPVLYGYPTSGAGHTIPVHDSAGAVIAYANNNSTCAIDSCPVAVVMVVDGAAPPSPTYTATYPLDVGKAYQVTDNIDPLATVVMSDCDNVPAIRIYPTSGAGHTNPVVDSAGNTIGYAQD